LDGCRPDELSGNALLRSLIPALAHLAALAVPIAKEGRFRNPRRVAAEWPAAASGMTLVSHLLRGGHMRRIPCESCPARAGGIVCDLPDDVLGDFRSAGT